MESTETSPKGLSTKQKILAEGLAIASSEGLDATTLGALALRAGMSKSGLYAHFRSKDELQIQILRTAEDLARREVLEPALHAEPGIPRLRAFLSNLIHWTRRANLPGGCPFVGAAAEFDDREGPVRDYVASTLGHWIGFLEECASEAMALGHISPETDSHDFAFQVCGIYLMHHTTSRLLRREDADATAERAFDSLVARCTSVQEPPGKASKRSDKGAAKRAG